MSSAFIALVRITTPAPSAPRSGPVFGGSFDAFSRSLVTCSLFPVAKSFETGGFSEDTKRKLADRAGHHCSLCLALTTCSDEEGKPFRIGDATHQAAASEGGPRHDSNQSDTERSSVDNGLWLCSSCHRKIDGDKSRYPVERLQEMKRHCLLLLKH